MMPVLLRPQALLHFLAPSIVICLLGSACNADTRLLPVKTLPALPADAPVTILGDQATVPDSAVFLGYLMSSDEALPAGDGPYYAEEQARDEARTIGGNLLKCTEKRQSNGHTKCRYLVYALPDITGLEDDIVWSADRPLTYDDFRGIPVQGGHAQARTTAKIGVRYFAGHFGGAVKVEVKTLFETNTSWMWPEHKTKEVLEHEQGHFDITELHARKIREELTRTPLTNQNAPQKIKEIYERHFRAMSYQNGWYDYEVTGNYRLLKKYRLTVKASLDSLQAFAYKPVL